MPLTLLFQSSPVCHHRCDLHLVNGNSDSESSRVFKEPSSGSPCYLCGEPTMLICLHGLVYECCPDCDEQFILASRRERTNYHRTIAKIERDVNRLVTIFVVVLVAAIVATWVFQGYPLFFDVPDWR